MTDERFWALIDPGCRDEDPKNQLRAALHKLSPEELVEFQRRLDAAFDRAFRWDIWCAAKLICGGCSDERFVDFRYSLVLRGRTVFEAALRDPDSLAYAKVTADPDVGYIALDAYEAKTGCNMQRDRGTQPTEPAGDRSKFDGAEQAKRRLPKLFSKYAAHAESMRF